MLSHSKSFLCTIWGSVTQTPKSAIQLMRQASSSAILCWDVTADMVTQHDKNHELLRDYLQAATPNNRAVAQAIRPVLEAFLRVAYSESFPAGTMLGSFINTCGQRVGASQEILNQTDITELTALKEYANLFHHDTNSASQSQHINDTQLLDFVRRAIQFTRR